uniref:Uncharacterized protein n=1 Tax=Pithovirus LCPAC304 TaxID=2506594 RepID=A0A481ZBZ9_9VIRU|nr:MAG: hypothetical protein LCPAC304_05480 [Pithovirus LCPAC304]
MNKTENDIFKNKNIHQKYYIYYGSCYKNTIDRRRTISRFGGQIPSFFGWIRVSIVSAREIRET